MLNRVTLVGRLTKDLELRYTNSNIAYVRFTVAVNRTFSNSNGEREADFISCIAWRKQAENMARFVSKGSQIAIDGRIQTGSYQDTDGKTVYTTDVVCDTVSFLESRNSGNNQETRGGYVPDPPFYNDNTSNQQQSSQTKQEQKTPVFQSAEDDLPF